MAAPGGAASLQPALGTPRAATILSVAAELPPTRLTSAELAASLGISEEWILSRTGVRERRRAAPGERLSDCAARAGERALKRAGVRAEDLDLVIVATLTQDEVTPNAAPVVAHALGATRAGAFDVGAACTAFLSGLAVGAAQIECGRAERILLIGADFVSRITNYEDKRTAPLFGDGVGAVVLAPANCVAPANGVPANGGGPHRVAVGGPGPSNNGAIGPIVLGADGSHAGTLTASHADRELYMDGPEVFRHAVARMSQVTHQALASAGLTLEDIDLFVYHQANARITKALGAALDLAPERVVDCIEYLGNTSAATLPIALDIAACDGRLRPGARVLLSAFGAGFTWGAGVIEWGVLDGG